MTHAAPRIFLHKAIRPQTPSHSYAARRTAAVSQILLRLLCIDVSNTAQTTSRSTAHTPLTTKLTNIPWSLPKCCFSITSAQTMPHNPPKRDSFAVVSFPKSSELLHGLFFRAGSATRFQSQAPSTSQSWATRIMKNIRMLSSHGGAQLFGQSISSSKVSSAKTSMIVRLLPEER